MPMMPDRCARSRSAEFDPLLALYAAAKEEYGAGLGRIVRASSALGAPHGEQHQRDAVGRVRLQLPSESDQLVDE